MYLKPEDFRTLENLGRDRSDVEMLRQARVIMIEQDRLEAESLGLTPPNSNYLRGTSGQATQGAGEPVDNWRTEKAYFPVAQTVRSFARTIEEIDRE